MTEVKKFGELEPGDIISGPHGEKLTISATYEEHLPETSYDVVIDDKERTTVNVSGSHLWYVETDTAIANHRARLKKSKKVLQKRLRSEAIRCLEVMASSPFIEEMTVQEFLEILGEYDDLNEVIQRVSRSVGPIEDRSDWFLDPDDNLLDRERYFIFDGRFMAQQILALYDKRKYTWKVIVGEVMDTNRLFVVQDIANIPDGSF